MAGTITIEGSTFANTFYLIQAPIFTGICGYGGWSQINAHPAVTIIGPPCKLWPATTACTVDLLLSRSSLRKSRGYRSPNVFGLGPCKCGRNFNFLVGNLHRCKVPSAGRGQEKGEGISSEQSLMNKLADSLIAKEKFDARQRDSEVRILLADYINKYVNIWRQITWLWVEQRIML